LIASGEAVADDGTPSNKRTHIFAFSMTVLKRGLDLPILGEPDQRIQPGIAVSQVGIVADDYIGMKPTMLVAEGDRVKQGQKLFEDKKNPGVFYTAPASGVVSAVTRGTKRKFISLVIQVEGDERVEFDGVRGMPVSSFDRSKVTSLLTESGLWTALRTRPFGNVPAVGSVPHSIFVTAIDTSPLAADPNVVLAGQKEKFLSGVEAIANLTDGKVFVCRGPKVDVPGAGIAKVHVETFEGPHPAGLVGTHIHFLDPVGPNKTVWYINYQDVVAIGAFLQTGVLDVRRVISLAGPVVNKPRLIETRLGASLDDLVAGEIKPGVNARVISGSVLCGRKSAPTVNFLGRYHSQISVLEEGTQREFLGWQKPGFDKYSITRVFASTLARGKKFAFTTSTEGSERAMVPLGTYEKVMPMDLLPTQLLRALIIRDTEQAQQLGALELEEEDVALCTFVCPGKYEYGTLLRDNLTTIQREG
jgi:Na+-transporting NADH:ubiquinone oxidoreductase subunit A